MKDYTSECTIKYVSLGLRHFFLFFMSLNLDNLEPNLSVSGLENIFEMQDESKSTLAVSN